MSTVKSKIREIDRMYPLFLYIASRAFYLNSKYARIYIHLSLDKCG